MPQSQLKRLKASLREQGIVGPQKSKKQKVKGLSTEQKIRRNVALESIRESFNPFEVRHQARPAKRDVTTQATLKGRITDGSSSRPGVSKTLGEQKRRKTLLLEVQSRNKVGGIVDRRIGEDDTSMGAEEKALQRYTWEKQRKGKKSSSTFNLEDDADGEDLLTHGGKTLDYNEDYDAASVEGSETEDEHISRKRVRQEIDAMEQALETDEPQRKKSRKEVMEEVIKKSKLYKFERQSAKEEDDEMRMELDKDLTDVRAALFAFQQAVDKPQPKQPVVDGAPVETAMHPDRAALIEDTQPLSNGRSYDEEMRRIANDKRARPSNRTKSEEELARIAADKKQEMDVQRLQRMAGLPDDESEDDARPMEQAENIFEPEEVDDAAEFGLAPNSREFRHSRPEGIDDEDDFLLDDDLVVQYESDDDDGAAISHEDEESEDELLMSGDDAGNPSSKSECPRTLQQLRAMLSAAGYEQYHEAIRQIRTQHDPAGPASNNDKLAEFAAALVKHLATLPVTDPKVPQQALDVLIRHLHSMARKTPDPITNAFRRHLTQIYQSNTMTSGDLVILTAIGAIYPTSDHFHPVVTPAITLIGRWLGSSRPSDRKSSTIGAYLVALCIQYQNLSKRYVPEAMRFTIAALSSQNKNTEQIHIANILKLADLWAEKSSFIEIFTPALNPLENLKATKATAKLKVSLAQAALARRPLQLHNHRPLAIKTAVPRFEEGFDPSKHYDPDPERAETQRLTRELKKERKGAMRELRKDANFLAREKLREKKEKDRAYDAKYKRLVAEIQGEEGRESKLYEREKMARRGKR